MSTAVLWRNCTNSSSNCPANFFLKNWECLRAFVDSRSKINAMSTAQQEALQDPEFIQLYPLIRSVKQILQINEWADVIRTVFLDQVYTHFELFMPNQMPAVCQPIFCTLPVYCDDHLDYCDYRTKFWSLSTKCPYQPVCHFEYNLDNLESDLKRIGIGLHCFVTAEQNDIDWDSVGQLSNLLHLVYNLYHYKEYKEQMINYLRAIEKHWSKRQTLPESAWNKEKFLEMISQPEPQPELQPQPEPECAPESEPQPQPEQLLQPQPQEKMCEVCSRKPVNDAQEYDKKRTFNWRHNKQNLELLQKCLSKATDNGTRCFKFLQQAPNNYIVGFAGKTENQIFVLGRGRSKALKYLFDNDTKKIEEYKTNNKKTLSKSPLLCANCYHEKLYATFAENGYKIEQ